MRKSLFARQYLLPILSRIGSPKFQNLVMRLLPWKSIQETLDLVDNLHNASVEIVKSRKKALEGDEETMEKQVGRGKDIMSMLCKTPRSLLCPIHCFIDSTGKQESCYQGQTFGWGSHCASVVRYSSILLDNWNKPTSQDVHLCRNGYNL